MYESTKWITTTGATSGAGTVYPGFCGIHVTRSLDLCVCLVDLCLTFLWPLCCLSVFDLRIMITLLVSSNSSWHFLAKSSILKRVTYQIKLADLQLSTILNSVGMSIPVSSQISLSLLKSWQWIIFQETTIYYRQRNILTEQQINVFILEIVYIFAGIQ